MTVTDQLVPDSAPTADEDLQRKAREHLWLHFSRQSALEEQLGMGIRSLIGLAGTFYVVALLGGILAAARSIIGI